MYIRHILFVLFGLEGYSDVGVFVNHSLLSLFMWGYSLKYNVETIVSGESHRLGGKSLVLVFCV